MKKLTKEQKQRLEKVLGIKLCKGTGETVDSAVCVMQAVDYVSTSGLTDQPDCSCPVLTGFAIGLNDRADDEHRQLLKPLIPKLIGTRDSAEEKRRAFLRHGVVTKVLPLLMTEIGLHDEVKKIRRFKPHQTTEMYDFCIALKPKMREAMKARLKGKGYAAAYAAYAYAAYAAYAYADAAYAADAAAYAAYADAEEKEVWIKLKTKIWKKAFSLLSEACEIKGKKLKQAA